MTPYESAPGFLLLRRVFKHLCVAFVVGFFCAGILGSLSAFQPDLKRPLPVAPLKTQVEGFPPISSVLQWKQTYQAWFDAPLVCVNDAIAVNDFQREQCAEYWWRALFKLLLASLPLFFAGIVGVRFWLPVRGVYRVCHRKALQGISIASGRVVKLETPVEDFFEKFFCMKSALIELPQGRVHAYYPESSLDPIVGDHFLIVEKRTVFGAERYLGWVYRPHLAVIRGVDSR